MAQKNKGYEIKNIAGVAEIKLIKGFDWWADNSIDFTREVDNFINQGIKNAKVYMNTPGGSMLHANEIANQLKRFENVSVKLGAICASAGTTVSSDFSDVEGSPNTMFMIHDPIYSPTIEHEEDFESQKALYSSLRNNAIEVYHKKTGKNKKDISAKMKATTWMDAKTAMAYGFIDRISEDPAQDSMPEDTMKVLNSLRVSVPEVLNTAIQNQISNTKEENNMKELALKLGLPENASTEEIMAAHNAAVEKAKQEGAKEKTEGAQNSASITLLMNEAKRKGFDPEKIKAKAEKNFELTAEMVGDAPEPKNESGDGGAAGDSGARLSQFLEGLKNNGETPKDKTFDEMSMAEKEAMAEKDPAKLEALAKESVKK